MLPSLSICRLLLAGVNKSFSFLLSDLSSLVTLLQTFRVFIWHLVDFRGAEADLFLALVKFRSGMRYVRGMIGSFQPSCTSSEVNVDFFFPLRFLSSFPLSGITLQQIWPF